MTMKKGGKRKIFQSAIREIIFGLGDSFMSTLGAITGIAIGVGDQDIVILSGLVLISVEALAMGAGSYLSSKAANEASIKHNKTWYTPAMAGFVMAFFYIIGGLITLSPYIFIQDIQLAMLTSIAISATSLLAVGSWKASVVGGSKMKSALEMSIISLFAAGLGFAIGRLASIYFGIEVL